MHYIQLKDRLQANTTIITIGTPIRGSNMGGSLDHIIGMILGIPFSLASIFTEEPLLYDRHLFDMRPLSRNFVISYYMKSLTLAWHNFLQTAIPEPSVFSIIGTRSGWFDNEITDSVVAAREAGFGEVPAGRRCYINKRHFNDIARIDSRDHHAYGIILEIVRDPKVANLNCEIPAPIQNMTWAIFIRPDAASFPDELFFDIDSEDPNPPPFLPFLNYPGLRFIDAAINFATAFAYIPYYVPLKSSERHKTEEEQIYKRVFGDYMISKNAACGSISRYTKSGEKVYRIALTVAGEKLAPVSWKCSQSDSVMEVPKNETTYLELSAQDDDLVISYRGKQVELRPSE